MKSFLQDADVNINVLSKSAIDNLETNELSVPSKIPIGMLVVVRPTRSQRTNAKEFWLGI